MKDPIQVQIAAMGSISAPRMAFDTGNPYQPYEPLPYFAEPGQTLVVEVEEGQDLSLRIGFSATPFPESHYSLNPGLNYINVNNAGALYLSNQSPDQEAHVKVHLPDDIKDVPTFVKGETDQQDFVDAIAANPESPIHFTGDRFVVVINPNSGTQQYFGDINERLEAVDFFLKAEDDLSGQHENEYGNSSDSVFSGQKTYLIETNAGWMWTVGTGYLAMNGPGGMSAIFDADSTFKWGPWHEAGHMHQMHDWTLWGSGEVVPNIWSYHVQTLLTGFGGDYHQRPMTADEVFNTDSYYTQDRHNEDWGPDSGWEDQVSTGAGRNIIYEQLYLGFGKEFYSNLTHYYRTLSDDELNELTNNQTEEGKASLFAIKASEITGYDLTSFFEGWHWQLTDDAKAQIKAMNLKELPFDLANWDIQQLKGTLYDDVPRIADLDYPEHPQAETTDDFGLVKGEIPDLDALVQPDSSVVNVEFLDPDKAENGYGVQYGAVNYEVLIENAEGIRNVVILKGYVVPDYYADASAEEIYKQAAADFDAENIEKYHQHIALLKFSDVEGAADMLSDIQAEIDELELKAIAFDKALADPDVTIVDAEEGIFELRIDKDLYDELLDYPRQVGFSVYSQYKKLDENGDPILDGYGNPVKDSTEIGAVRNERLYDGMTRDDDGEDYIFTIHSKVPIDEELPITIDSLAPHMDTLWRGTVRTQFKNLDELAAPKPLTVESLEKNLNYWNIVNEENGFSFTIHDSLFEQMNEEGDFKIELLQNGEVIGTAQNTSNGGVSQWGDMQFMHHEGNSWFYTMRDGILPDDELTYRIHWKSDDPDASFDGTVEMNVRGTWVGAKLTEQVNTGTEGDDLIVLPQFTGKPVNAGAGDDTISTAGGNDTIYGDNGVIISPDGIGSFTASTLNAKGNLYGEQVSGLDPNEWFGANSGIVAPNANTSTFTADVSTTLLDDQNYAQIFPGGHISRVIAEKGEASPSYNVSFDQYFQTRSSGDMTVSLVDGSGNVLDSKSFTMSGQETHHSANLKVPADKMGEEITLRFSANGNAPVIFDNVELSTAFGANAEESLFSADDRIASSTGDDFVFGQMGDDTVFSGPGNDHVYGGTGNDVVLGADGEDTLTGGAGDDFLSGGVDYDWLDGGDGNDSIVGEAGNDSILGRAGNDVAYGGSGDDRIDDITTGDDSLFGDDGHDTILAREGDDVVDGGAGNDMLYGGDGKDQLNFAFGEDKVYGGADEDVINLDFFRSNTEAKVLTVDGGSATTSGKDYDVLNIKGLSGIKITQTTDADGNSTSGTITGFDNSDGHAVEITFSEIEEMNITLPCFTKGTLIETPSGCVAIETLKKGDLVKTLDHGDQPILWIGSITLNAAVLEKKPKLRPVLIPKNALGINMPDQDSWLSPLHRVFLNAQMLPEYTMEEEALIEIRHLEGYREIAIDQECDEVTYYHFITENHEIVFANGMLAETLLLGEHSREALSMEAREELSFLFPEIIGDMGDGLIMWPARNLVEKPGRVKVMCNQLQKHGQPIVEMDGR